MSEYTKNNIISPIMGEINDKSNNSIDNNNYNEYIKTCHIKLENNFKLKNTSPGPKYLVLSRNDENKNMSNISPFFIKKAVDAAVSGTVEKCHKCRNGTVLIQTKNVNQAEKLLKLSSLTDTINVQVSEHNSLNQMKGVIFFRDFIYLSDQEILENLAEQRVTEIRRFTKNIDNVRIQTGLFTLTFDSCTLPEFIKIGYEVVNIRPYIPLPVRCMNCYKFGHLRLNCKKEQTCPNCSETYHLKENEDCQKEPKCTNCNNKHSSLDRTCIIFVKEKEIQRIKTIEKVDMREAIRRYRMRNPANFTESFASVVSKGNKTCGCKCSCSEKAKENVQDQKQEVKEAEKSEKSSINEILKTVNIKQIEAKDNKQLTILPKNLSKRQKKILKQAKKKKMNSGSDEICDETDDSNNNPMDFE